MFGFDAIAGLAIGEMDDTLVYAPVSRIIAGGFSNGRPVEVAVLGVDLLWDDEQEMIWDNGDSIGWEA